MIEKLKKFYIVILFVFLGSVVLAQYYYNERLSEQLKARQELIDDMLSSDSLYKASTKAFTDYVSDCSIVINDQSSTMPELLDTLRTTLEKSDSLKFKIKNLENSNRSGVRNNQDPLFRTINYLQHNVNSLRDSLLYQRGLIIQYRDSVESLLPYRDTIMHLRRK